MSSYIIENHRTFFSTILYERKKRYFYGEVNNDDDDEETKMNNRESNRIESKPKPIAIEAIDASFQVEWQRQQ